MLFVLRSVRASGADRVVLAFRAAHCGHVGLHQLLHHLQPGTDSEGE